MARATRRVVGRRALLGMAAVAAAGLAAPRILRAADQTTLRFVPQTDIAGYDPVWSSAQVTRNYSFLVFDTLFGVDNAYQAQPQMAEGAVPERNFAEWRVQLRPGLKFHDGEPVLARDCAASLLRWTRRDSFGQAVGAALNEIDALDDRTIRLRMKRPFPRMLDALAKSTANVPAMMPERLAKTDPFQQIPEVVGSGPFRLMRDEGVPGVRIVFAKNADYRPRETGASEWTSGPKIVHFDRVEWQIIPDATTAAIALQKGEIDWWETPTTDYLQLLRRTRNVEVAVKDPTGSMPTLRMNWLNPPFDNPAVRRAVLAAVSQLDTMTVVAGSDPELYRTGVGFFPPGSALASSAGIPPAGKPPDHEAIKRDIIAAGYKGERVVILGVSDRSSVKVMGDVTADLFQRIGLNTDYQMADWGTQNARINSKKPPDQGGWSVYFAIWSGLSVINPIVHQHLRGDGLNSIAGWPDAPKLEALRFAWLDSTDAAEQRRIAVDIQRQAYEDVPYVPLGQFFQPVAYRSDLTGMLAGFPLFWNIKRSA